MKKDGIILLSVEETIDTDYGTSLVWYQMGDIVSCIFSSQYEKNYDPDVIREEICIHLEAKQELISSGQEELPLWSDLSEDLRSLIVESAFDMLFIDDDDGDWSDERIGNVLAEVHDKFPSLSFVVEPGEEEGAGLIIYAGAMCGVNWMGSPEAPTKDLLPGGNKVPEFTENRPWKGDYAISPDFSDILKILSVENGIYVCSDPWGNRRYETEDVTVIHELDFHVGDVVKVKSDLKDGTVYGSTVFCENMLPYLGKTVTIRDIRVYSSGTVYVVCGTNGQLEDIDKFVWSAFMFEAPINVQPKEYEES